MSLVVYVLTWQFFSSRQVQEIACEQEEEPAHKLVVWVLGTCFPFYCATMCSYNIIKLVQLECIYQETNRKAGCRNRYLYTTSDSILVSQKWKEHKWKTVFLLKNFERAYISQCKAKCWLFLEVPGPAHIGPPTDRGPDLRSKKNVRWCSTT
jgi:hypothetical protein